MKSGVHMPLNEKMTVAQYFDQKWLPDRQKRYEKPTWGSDLQRFNDYVRPTIGNIAVARINALQVRSALKAVVDQHNLSIKTRNRVRALLSTMFGDAMGEEPPLRADNPAMNIRFKDPRQGVATPSHLKKHEDIKAFMRAARSLSTLHDIYSKIELMSGLRKSELIPLKYGDVDEAGELIIRRRYLQASRKIKEGTKKGVQSHRAVPIPDLLVAAILKYRDKQDFQSDDDFILCKPDGTHFDAKQIWNLHVEIREAAGVNVTVHGLRHTFGREWAAKGGNMKELQAALGHESSATTDIYSNLAGRGRKEVRNTVKFEVDDE